MKKQDFKKRKIAYFTMEVGLEPKIATYSGGLGVLAGDTIKSCADLGVPLIAVTLLNEKGYFAQKLDADGSQAEIPVEWPKEQFLTLLPIKVSVNIEAREVKIQVWEYIVKGITGATVPVYFLDTGLAENNEYDRTLTSFLYGGDQWYRLCQEIILGIGGLRAIEATGYQNIEKYHMNEGHASLLALELLERTKKDGEEDMYKKYDLESVRNRCIFTTHTPVAAGHDRFPLDFVKRALRSNLPFEMPGIFIRDNEMNMTLIALNLSKYVNGVAKKHGEVTREMFPGYTIDSITNGIHLLTWVATAFKRLYDKYILGWAIGSAQKNNTDSAQDAHDLYQKLEKIIIPMFYKEKDKWIDIMRHAIALNASFFNTQRMVQEYVLNAYL